MRAIKTKRFRLYHGDNLEALRLLADNSVDSVVTDPPYGLGKEPDPYELMRQWHKTGHYKHTGKRGFMGNTWDAFVPQPELWKEVYRVLKPGGHLLSFFGTRTYDIGTLAIRLAGFEIRDQLAWIYGSGFPKSLNVGKAIEATQPVGNSHRRFLGWGTALKPAQEPIVLARKPLEGTVAKNVLSHGTGGLNIEDCRISINSDAANFANNHNGINRSLKKNGESLGAYGGGWKVQKGEKKLPTGRFPANVLLTHHQECRRIGTKVVGKGPVGGYDYSGKKEYNVEGFVKKNKPNSASNRGAEVVERWECHHDCPVTILDKQSGKSKSYGGKGDKSKGGLGGAVYAGGWRGDPGDSLGGFGDVGGASRFFYCSKASKRDRNAGCDESAHEVSGRAKNQGRLLPIKNTHPTVKPIALMRYLCRLITPENGIVLDPYMGSGSTGRAARLEGFRFIGMELQADFFEISHRRIATARN